MLRQSIARQFAPAGHAEQVDADALAGQQFCGLDDFGQDGARAEQRDLARRIAAGCSEVPLSGPVSEPVASSEKILFHACGQVGLRVVLIHQRDVVENILLLNQHLAHAALDDHREFTGEGGVP